MPGTASKASVRRGSPNMELQLSPPKNALITNFFRIHDQYSNSRRFLDFPDIKAARVFS